MKEIEISNGEKALVDDEDYVLLNSFQWKKHRQGYVATEFLMHRYIMHPMQKGYEVHHKNGNKLDNRKENLLLIKSNDHRKLHVVALVAHQKSIQKYPDIKKCVLCRKEFKVNPRKRKRNKCCSQICAQLMRVAGRKKQAERLRKSFPKSPTKSLKESQG